MSLNSIVEAEEVSCLPLRVRSTGGIPSSSSPLDSNFETETAGGFDNLERQGGLKVTPIPGRLLRDAAGNPEGFQVSARKVSDIKGSLQEKMGL